MIGIDYKIDKLRAVFQAVLFEAVASNTYMAYGRAFVNTSEHDESVPQILVAGTNDYKSVRFDDNLDGISFMIVSNPVSPMSVDTYVDMIGEVDIYFAINLKNLYPNVTERAVEYLHKDVLEILSDSEFEFTSYMQGLEAFSEFSSVKSSDNKQPYYLCKFSTVVEFQINENINC